MGYPIWEVGASMSDHILDWSVSRRSLRYLGLTLVVCREVVYEGGEGHAPSPLARPGRPRIVVGLG